MSDGLTSVPSDSLRREPGESPAPEARAEFLLEKYRVTGVIEHLGVARRLVDVLNTADGPTIVLRDASVQSLIDPGEDQRRFDLLQLRREAVLLAMPVRDVSLPSRGPEVVEKRPVVATLLLPGLKVTGRIYLPPEADPSAARLLDRPVFLPVTDAEVVQVDRDGHGWQEPLVVVNLARAQLYAVTAGDS